LSVELARESEVWGRQDTEEEPQNILLKMSTFLYVPQKRRLTFNWLHAVISQKTLFFTITAVRTSNLKTTLSIHAILISQHSGLVLGNSVHT
jgi:hypothetical protein